MDIGVEDIRQWHMRKGWRDVGYHSVIRRDGTEEMGRPEDETGAHAGPRYNPYSLAVCLVGGISDLKTKKPEDNFTEPQTGTLALRLAQWKSRYPSARVIGHGELPGVPPRACPSFSVPVGEWWAAVCELIPKDLQQGWK